MQALISKFMALPIPGKAVIGMVMAGGIFGVCHLLGMNELGYFLGIAMAVVTVVLALFGLVMEKRDKKKAENVEANIADSAAATPSGVSKVADRAKLDDLRRQFESGVQTFRDYGKNLYDMPWYVVVGEPGSGKTEAIRHSGIGFPPGLQDQLQGTGGTVNMNWWFTDQSVIIDTAGRLMFEDVAPGDNNEWKEFLKLLRTSRPNCPINGMLLVIPADTLITDKPDEIEKKAGKIAQQFDQIQRSLGVRFPVFVLITKADLVNGFREFFDDITDPRLTAQMLGWSNPADLDEPFKPDRVEEHLDSLRQHLLQRRFAMLQDPIHSEDPKGRRIDQVDALYKFPEAVTELGPRLRRYLEMIFVAGEWSQKPLFLRGIYFTSSMREGDALDADLAEVLGVGVSSLAEGKLWERERSYFLRDLFLDKVFKERGLVTRAANAGQVKRKRAMLISGAAAVASLLLGAMIWYSYSQTKAQIQNPRDFWVEVRGAVEEVASTAEGNDDLSQAEALRQYLSPLTVRYSDASVRDLIIAQPLESEDAAVRLGGVKLTYLEVFERARKYYEENSSSSGLFALIAALPGGGNDIFKRQLPAQRGLFEQLVLVRAIELARGDIIDGGANRSTPIGWGDGALGSKALAAMIALEADGTMGNGEPLPAETIDELVRFAVAAEGPDAVDADAMTRLREYASWLYSGDSSWPPETLPVGTESANAAVERGIEAFNRFWRNPSGEGTLFGALKTLEAAGGSLTAAEETLAGASRELGAAATEAAFDEKKGAWLSAYDRYRASYDAFSTALGEIPEQYVRSDFGSAALPEEARLAVWDSASSAYDELIGRFGDETRREKLDPENEREAWLIDQREALVAARNTAENAYRSTAEQLVGSIRDRILPRHLAQRGLDRVFTVRSNLFAQAHGALTQERVRTGDSLRAELDSIKSAPDSQVVPATGEDLASAAQSARLVHEAAARSARYAAMRDDLERLRDWEQLLTRESADPLPMIPFTGLSSLEYERRFAPENNKLVLGSFTELRAAIDRPGEDGSAYVLDAESLRTSLKSIERGLESHLDEYERFWTEDVPAAIQVQPGPSVTWRDLLNELPNSRRIFDAFETLREIMGEALGDPATATNNRVADLAKAVAEEEDDDDLRGMIRTDVVARWRRLSDDAARAGESLRLSAEQKEVMDAYFPLEQTAAFKDPWELGPEETYWRSFTLAAIERIARESADDKEGAIVAVEPLCRRFPITLNADPANGLDTEEIRRVASTLGGVGVLASSTPITAVASPFDWISSDEIRQALDRISGRSLLQDAPRVGRLRRALGTAEFLSKNAGNLTFTLAAQGANYPKNVEQGTHTICEQVDVAGKPNVLGEPGFTLFESREVFWDNYYWSLPMGDRIEFRFQNANRDAPVTATLGRWAALSSLASVGGAVEFNDGTRRAQVWPIEFRLSNGRSFWMGAVFSGGDADALSEMRNSWLTKEEW